MPCARPPRRRRDMGFVGRSVARLEDRPLVTGQGRFAADIAFAHMLHMRVVRSPSAHGRIRAIDTAPAVAAPGVVAAWTFADVADIPPIDFRLSRIEGLAHYRQTILARGRVRYVGDPVAVVFAADAYLAEDAADRVRVDIEDLPPVLDAAAPACDFDVGRSTEAAVVEKAYGDVGAAFARAHAVVALDLGVGRHSGVPIETRGAVAHYDAARDVLELHGAAKVPHWNRDAIARMLGRDPPSVQLYEGHVGGGFGIRGELYPEDVLACLAALRLRRPVKWIEDRREHLIAANHSREQRHHARAAVDAQGRILAIDNVFFHDQGAYMRTHAVTVPDLAAAMLPGPYRVPAYRARGHVRLTNKTPGGTYRAPGRYESTFVRERLMDAIAARVGVDAVEIRRRNFIAAAQMPYRRALATLGTDIVLDSGDYAGLLDKALAAIGWRDLQATLSRRRAAGESVGAGLAFFVEKSGLGPFDGVRVGVDASGGVEVVTGAASVGQGVETVIAQICADVLGVDYRRVRVVHGQTDRIAFGMGAFASRVTVMTGEATRRAGHVVRAKALELAAELMQQPAAALDIVDGVVVRAGAEPGPAMPLGEVARALEPGSRLRGARAPGLAADGWFHTDHMTYPYGVHIAVARVDRETGGVAIERYFVAYDVGKAVNPMLVEGQIHGGVVQGLGQGLFEELTYEPTTGQLLAGSFMDYAIPRADDVPFFDVDSHEVPTKVNPLGAKGVGEAGTVGALPALLNAVNDALAPLGVRHLDMPVTPERVWRAIREATGTRQETIGS
ncbi:MAG: xanthine dehydrogenase family protein molybdopterin-binding subunit [Proteobacteria bacterium]|nr:xanthine dehydrogenase family protein molybdopterin-binding subunit [Pseudomonadota bacterium]